MKKGVEEWGINGIIFSIKKSTKIGLQDAFWVIEKCIVGLSF